MPSPAPPAPANAETQRWAKGAAVRERDSEMSPLLNTSALPLLCQMMDDVNGATGWGGRQEPQPQSLVPLSPEFAPVSACPPLLELRLAVREVTVLVGG